MASSFLNIILTMIGAHKKSGEGGPRKPTENKRLQILNNKTKRTEANNANCWVSLRMSVVLKVYSRDSAGSFGGVRIDSERGLFLITVTAYKWHQMDPYLVPYMLLSQLRGDLEM